MHITANAAVTRQLTTFVRTVCFVVGLLVATFAINAAVDFRTESYFSNITPTEMSAREIQQQLTCLSRNIYWEAGSEPFEGKVAVAQVTMNRMSSGKFANTVCGVVQQKTIVYNKVVCQFSWLCENTHLTKPIYKAQYKESEEVAKMVMLEGFKLKTLEGALYYHADYVNPRWNKEKITQIGRHIFYKDKSNG